MTALADKATRRPPGGEGWRIPLAIALAHAVVWALYGTVSQSGGIHNDMAEAYAWGREFQLGYYKHPPFWAWITGLWFEALPRANWSFMLLSSLNAGVGLAGLWLLIGRFARGPERLAAFSLIYLLPFYTFLSLKFNANTIFLSLWPWTAYALVRSLETRRLVHAAALGALAAACLLSKYYAVVLLATCFAASLVHPERRAWYRSASPYAAAAIAAALVAPHAWWLVASDFPTFTYADSKTHFTHFTILWKLLRFAVGCTAFHVVLAAVLLWVWRRDRPERAAALYDHAWLRRPLAPVALVLGLGPMALTMAVGVIGNVKLATPFAIPIFGLTPLLAVMATGLGRSPRLARTAPFAAAALTLGALIAAPVVNYTSMRLEARDTVEPRQEIALRATAVWREVTGAPLRLVSGTETYSLATTFYSPDRPMEFTGFDRALAPWVTDATFAETGLLAVCLETDGGCLGKAQALARSQPQADRAVTRRLAVMRRAWDLDGPPFTFVLVVIPPTATPQPAP